MHFQTFNPHHLVEMGANCGSAVIAVATCNLFVVGNSRRLMWLHGIASVRRSTPVRAFHIALVCLWRAGERWDSRSERGTTPGDSGRSAQEDAGRAEVILKITLAAIPIDPT